MAIRRIVSSMLSPAQKSRIRGFVSKQLQVSPQARCELPYKVLIGTHHKTGVVWLKSIFQAICAEYSLRFFAGEQAEAPADYDVLFQRHSRFNLASITGPVRGVHIIRDPRDIILSGCFYHQTSDEKWLHVPRQDLGGRTYQEAINSCETLDEQILLEMENTGAGTVEEMVNWDYTHPAFFELKYEDLIKDTSLLLFHRVFTFLGFPGSVVPSLLAIAYSKSLFSGQVKSVSHIRSGEVAQWEQYFRHRHNQRFLELFGDVLIRLGYETDHSWASRG